MQPVGRAPGTGRCAGLLPAMPSIAPHGPQRFTK
jgi:hypothetical protein